VRRVIPINVGITRPNRLRMNCNITLILSNDGPPGHRSSVLLTNLPPFLNARGADTAQLPTPRGAGSVALPVKASSLLFDRYVVEVVLT
jgi:hypothetical protein